VNAVADIFVSAPGEVMHFKLDHAASGRGEVPAPADIKEPPLIENRPFPIIFGAIHWEQATHQQFARSLDGSIYIYVFGDKMGEVLVHGLAFDRLCSGDTESGLKKVLTYYETNRASNRDTPIKLEIATKIVQGFLTSAKVEAVGGAESPVAVVHRYSLGINTLPND
jgi:hypothetical protein